MSSKTYISDLNIYLDLKLLYILPLLLVLVVPVAFAEEFVIEFPNNTVFVKGEAVFVNAFGVNFDSTSRATVIVLDNAGTQIDTFEFDIARYVGEPDQGWIRIETNNLNYQTDILYTVKSTYQGQESQLQFTLSDPPTTTEELAVIVETQESSFNNELETLRNENIELRNQITNLNQRIDDLVSQITNLSAIVQEQINVMMAFFQ